MYRRTKYSQSDKDRFWKCLEAYRKALATGTKEEIIVASIRIHAAKGGVPRSYYPFVNRVFKETEREISLED